MGAGRGRTRRAKAVMAAPGATTGLRTEASELLDRALAATPKALASEKAELRSWEKAYSDSGDLRYSAALTLWTLSADAEKKGRKINKRTPEKEREILIQRAAKDWRNYDDIRMAAEFEGMRYLAENYPDTKVNLDPTQVADYEDAIEVLKEKTGMDSFKVWEAHYIPKQSDDPILRFLQESYGDEFPYSATFVPDEGGQAAPPMIVTENMAADLGLPIVLIHESTHIAYQHTTRTGNLGMKVIEGCTDSATWMAIDRDEVLYNHDPQSIGYAQEIKFALACALTQPCESRDQLIENISRLSKMAGNPKNICNKDDKRILSEYTGVPVDKVDWLKFFKQNACDESVGVNALRDRIVACAPEIFQGQTFTQIEDVTCPW